jgi:hypothetical protein
MLSYGLIFRTYNVLNYYYIYKINEFGDRSSTHITEAVVFFHPFYGFIFDDTSITYGTSQITSYKVDWREYFNIFNVLPYVVLYNSKGGYYL